MSSKEIMNWSDKAMFEAEPIEDTNKPKVYLLSMNADPLGDIASASQLYTGGVRRSLDEVTDEERRQHFTDLAKTRIQAPFEFVRFHFLMEGVTRGFTHQMVRQRTATYVQESMRFAVKEDMPVALPPSLLGTDDAHANKSAGYHLSEKETQRVAWDEAVERLGSTYRELVNMGMPAEDARGLAPTNVLTRIHYTTDLRALGDHAGNRLCTQAQFEWREVWNQIIAAIRAYPLEGGRNSVKPKDAWQFDMIANIFKPICYITGKCEFMAQMDRHCSIRDRVQANHAIGRPSSEWDTPVLAPNGKIPAILDREWMEDSTSARIK